MYILQNIWDFSCSVLHSLGVDLIPIVGIEALSRKILSLVNVLVIFCTRKMSPGLQYWWWLRFFQVISCKYWIGQTLNNKQWLGWKRCNLVKYWGTGQSCSFILGKILGFL